MNTSKAILSQLNSRQFLMDGGLETTLIFGNGYDLPEFAAFPLLESKQGRDLLRDYYMRYIYLAKKNHCGFILESPTWRASQNWGNKLDYDAPDLKRINHQAIDFLKDLRVAFADTETPMVISGCIGPHGDGYNIDHKLSVDEAKKYHQTQIGAFCEVQADMISAYTINYVEEAVGISLAAQEACIPVVISFTVETDGRLPSGQPLAEAINTVDLVTGNGPLYYMINCAHPSHFKHVLAEQDQQWLKRIRAVRANASRKSHAELDGATELDGGDLQEFGAEHAELVDILPNLSIFGGCCGTDHHHIEEICRKIFPQFHPTFNIDRADI